MKLADLLASPGLLLFVKWTTLLALGWLAHATLRHQHARWRVILWRGILCIGLLLPVMQWLSLSIVNLPLARPSETTALITQSSPGITAAMTPLPTAQSQPAASAASTHTQTKSAATSSLTPPPKPLPWDQIILGVWALGALLGTIRLASLHLKLSDLRGSTELSPQTVRDLAGQIQNRFSLSGIVEIRLSEKVASPFVCGLLQPIVILPKTLMSKLSSSETDALLSHELAHLRQNDLLWCLAWRWTSVVFWFHPLVWAIPSAHNLACEQEADRLAARTLSRQDSYPQLLARLVLLVHALPAVETRLTVNGSSKIVQRLKHLEQSVHQPWDWRHIVTGYGLIAALFLLTAGCEISRQYQTPSGTYRKQHGYPMDMVAHWSGNTRGKDTVGHHNATIPEDITYAPANVGKGFNFNGGEHRIIVADAPDLNIGVGQDFSIEAWIQPRTSPVLAKGQPSSPEDPGLTDDIMTIVDKRNQPDLTRSLGYELCLWGGLLHFHMSDSLRNNGASWGFSYGHDLRDGKFHHVAVTVIRNSPVGGKLYVDGQLLQTFDPTDVSGDLSNDRPLRIGNHPDPMYHCFFKGIIGEVSIFRRALTTDEILSLYENGGGRLQPAALAPALPAIDPALKSQALASHPEGLVALWSGENNGADLISGQPAELTDIDFTGEKSRKAFSFNGRTSTIKIPATPTLDLGAADGFTIMAWIKPTDINGLHPFLQWTDNGNLNLWIGIRPFENGVFRGDIGSKDRNHFVCSNPNVLVSDAYQHLTMTYDKASGIGTLYVNGVVVAHRQLGTQLIAHTKGDIMISQPDNTSGNWSSGRMYSGLINNIEFYNRALSTAEVQSVCTSENKGEPLTQPEQSDGWFKPWML